MEGKYFVIDPSSHDEPLGYLENGIYWEPKNQNPGAEFWAVADLIDGKLIYPQKGALGVVDWNAMTLTPTDGSAALNLKKA